MKSPWQFVLSVVVGLTAILAIMMAAFSLPAVHSGINQIPIGIVATTDATYQKVRVPLEEKGFKVTRFDTAKQAEKTIEERKNYGAFVIDSTGDLTIYKATAASTAVAQLLTDVGNGLVSKQKAAAQAHLTELMAKTTDVIQLKVLMNKAAALSEKKASVIDIKAFPKDDSKRTGLAAGALPIALGGWIGAVAIGKLIKGKKQKFIGVISFAVIGGLGLIGVLQYWIGTFDGNYLLTSLGAMIGIGATGFFVLGILEVLGTAGLGIAAILLILLGNPLSGLLSAPELLPAGWGAFGQLLPPGATGTLLRNITFFDGHAIAQPLLVLGVYICLGMFLFKLGKKSTR
ncbi:MAG: ABC transporter permease [Lactococcus sp.]|nr:ABC transporter permease [Lactococcus sp.]